jgi:hypothetical protein
VDERRLVVGRGRQLGQGPVVLVDRQPTGRARPPPRGRPHRSLRQLHQRNVSYRDRLLSTRSGHPLALGSDPPDDGVELPSVTVVLWDADGTLLRTGGAGAPCFRDGLASIGRAWPETKLDSASSSPTRRPNPSPACSSSTPLEQPGHRQHRRRRLHRRADRRNGDDPHGLRRRTTPLRDAGASVVPARLLAARTRLAPDSSASRGSPAVAAVKSCSPQRLHLRRRPRRPVRHPTPRLGDRHRQNRRPGVPERSPNAARGCAGSALDPPARRRQTQSATAPRPNRQSANRSWTPHAQAACQKCASGAACLELGGRVTTRR